MILEQHRCVHCHAHYTYQASGWGSGVFNDGKYCPKCKEAIVVALKVIPPVSEKTWEPTNDVTAGTLVDIETRRWQETLAKGDLPVRRVLSPLFDMGNPTNTHHNGIVKMEGKTYRYEYWSLWGVEKGHVFVECEVTGGEVIGPWSLTDRWHTPPTFCEHEPWPNSEPTHKLVPKPFSLSRVSPRRFAIPENQSIQDFVRDFVKKTP